MQPHRSGCGEERLHALRQESQHGFPLKTSPEPTL
jgi:hypothetical protein